ncbi:LacI family DNA-binding transcriptional regulator [Ectobacillus ponti]|uniref:LacI family transcriptional regulator n=1 Tax=Ectobacillus ponti TaxID=2961894 RepID=A0AA41XDQ6_9BACI|nr:LacI family transcriptional regulator [Ectobacillus ponti]
MSYTIHDIAALAGVSKSTVSRVISGKGYTSEAARDRVLQAVAALQYKPNAIARAMASQRTHNIGVILYREQQPIASHPVYGKMLDAILAEASQLQYSVFVTTEREMSAKSADFMMEQRVDGLILISRLSQEVIGHIGSFGVPYIMVNGTTDKGDVVQLVNEDRTGGALVAEHLYEQGHRNVSIIAGPQAHRSHNLRFTGFCERMRELGGRIVPQLIHQSATSAFMQGYEGVFSLWEPICALKPTALFATNDALALGAMQAFWKQQWTVPEDIAVAGFDDTEHALMAVPPLTTVRVDTDRMGRDAVRLLHKLIQKESMERQTVYQPRLIVRESTALYKGECSE